MKLQISKGANPWFVHPWRMWFRPRIARRTGNLVHFKPFFTGLSQTHADYGSADDNVAQWVAKSFPHAFWFDGGVPYAEVRAYMDEMSTDLWTMGEFPNRFLDRVMIYSDDDAFAFRMRFPAKYQTIHEADEMQVMFNTVLGVMNMFGGLKMRL